MPRALHAAALALAAAAAVVSAFPSAFVSVVTYDANSCGGTPSRALYYALGECYAQSAMTSARYSTTTAASTGSVLAYTTFNGTSCSGTGVVVPFGTNGDAVPNGASTCVSGPAPDMSKRYTVPVAADSAANLWSVTYFSDSACSTAATTIATGLPAYPNPVYLYGSDGMPCSQATLKGYTYVGGGELYECAYANSCLDEGTCTPIAADTCAQQTVNATARSRRYSYHSAAAPRASGAVVFAALAAFLTAAGTRHF